MADLPSVKSWTTLHRLVSDRANPIDDHLHEYIDDTNDLAWILDEDSDRSLHKITQKAAPSRGLSNFNDKDDMPAEQEKIKVVIVGAGIFGISTALWMLRSGRYEVVVLDKSGILPAPDAASTDINKIVRAGDYADPHFARFAIEAVEEWKKPEWEGVYHESGVMCLSAPTSAEGHHFVEQAYLNCTASNLPCARLNNEADIARAFAERLDAPAGGYEGKKGYLNTTGGWAESGRSLEVAIRKVRRLGGVVRGGFAVEGLIRDAGGKKVKGVKVKGEDDVMGDLVVVTAGAWTPALCASEGMNVPIRDVVATGQSVATIQLSPEEQKRYSRLPVVFNLDTGFYLFPPNPDGLIKLAVHDKGVTNPPSGKEGTSYKDTSVPRTKLTPGAEDGMIPLRMLQKLRRELRRVYPELGEKDFVYTRLCWYADTPTGDWLIDYHPTLSNLFIASGDSGHGYKFTPILGREILAIIEKRGDPEFTKRWAFGGVGNADSDERSGTRQVIVERELAKPSDLFGGRTRAAL